MRGITAKKMIGSQNQGENFPRPGSLNIRTRKEYTEWIEISSNTIAERFTSPT